jgi:hypothetical protein
MPKYEVHFMTSYSSKVIEASSKEEAIKQVGYLPEVDLSEPYTFLAIPLDDNEDEHDYDDEMARAVAGGHL